jgi:hypothetical protein
MLRDDGKNPKTFNKNYYIESTDGVTWTNASGGFSKTITSGSTFITRTEADTHCSVYGTAGTEDVHMKCGAVTPSDMPVGICNNMAGDGYVFLFFSGGVWNTRAVNLSVTTQELGLGNTGRTDYWGLYAYSDTRFILWRIEVRNSYRVVVQYETTDAFVSINAGTVISDTNKNHEMLQITCNLDSPVIVIAASHATSSGNPIFLHEFRP